MNSYHQALNDAKVVIDDLGQRCQAVGCAGSIATEKEYQSSFNFKIKCFK